MTARYHHNEFVRDSESVRDTGSETRRERDEERTAGKKKDISDRFKS